MIFWEIVAPIKPPTEAVAKIAAEGGRGQVEVVCAVQQEHGPDRDHGKVAAEPDERQRSQDGIAEDPAQAFAQFDREAALGGGREWTGFVGRTDQQQRDHRYQVGERVSDQRHRRRQCADEETGEPWTGHVSRRGADPHLRAGLDVVLGVLHEGGHVRHPAHVEQHRCDTDCAGDDQQRRHAETVQPVQHRDEGEKDHPREVGGEHDLPPPDSIDPDSEEQRQSEVRGELQESQYPDLLVGGVECDDRGQWQREVRDLGPEQRQASRRARILRKLRVVPQAF